MIVGTYYFSQSPKPQTIILSSVEIAKINYEQQKDLASLIAYGHALDTSMLNMDSTRAYLQSQFFKMLAKEAGNLYNIPQNILYGLWMRESRMDPKAMGDMKFDSTGRVIPNSFRAFGLGQIHLKTAQGHYDSGMTQARLMDPVENGFASAKILRDYADMFNGDFKYGISAYQQGPANTQSQWKRKQEPKNISYVLDVLQNAAEIMH